MHLVMFLDDKEHVSNMHRVTSTDHPLSVICCAGSGRVPAGLQQCQQRTLPAWSSLTLNIMCQEPAQSQPQILSSGVQVVEEYLEDYNSASSAPMRLVMFLDAVEHVSRVSRVIRLPRGHALLLGVGGSGRQSLTRLAAHMQDFDVYQIEISKGYSACEPLRCDLRLSLW